MELDPRALELLIWKIKYLQDETELNTLFRK